MITTGAMLLIGVIALKAFGGIKGITGMFEGVSGLLGGGGVSSGIDLISTGDTSQIDLLRGLTREEVEVIAETKKVESTYDILGMMGWVAGPAGALIAPWFLRPFEEGQKAAIIHEYNINITRNVAVPDVDYVPSPIPIQPDPIIFPSDPDHPATDPFIGGR